MIARVFSVTGTTVTVNLAVSDYSATPPACIVTVYGSAAAGTPNVVAIMQNIGGLGFVCTGFTLTFAAGDVGKSFCMLTTPQV